MNLEKVLTWPFSPLEHNLQARDCMLYALGIGIGADASAPADLQFCYEKDLKVFPALVNVVAHPGGWITAPELEVDWVKLLHGEQSFEIFQPLEAGKTYVGHYRVRDVLDKGEGKGALLFLEKELRDKETGERVSLVTSTYFLRGDGGSGGTITQAPAPHNLPERPADQTLSLPTLPQTALIYRLSGDYNPIHAEPALAAKAGFERPILHGLCTLAVATRAVLKAYAGDDPARLKSLQLRFSAPVYPGETIVTEFWREGNVISFRAKVAERDLVILNNGRAVINH
jgi:acyl dehydratase